MRLVVSLEQSLVVSFESIVLLRKPFLILFNASYLAHLVLDVGKLVLEDYGLIDIPDKLLVHLTYPGFTDLFRLFPSNYLVG